MKYPQISGIIIAVCIVIPLTITLKMSHVASLVFGAGCGMLCVSLTIILEKVRRL